jgi:hypothetical protein
MSKQLITALERLVDTNVELEKEYAAAATDAHGEMLRNAFMQHAAERARFVSRLRSLVELVGGAPHEGGRTDRAILERCLAREKEAEVAYAQAMTAVGDAGWSDVRREIELQLGAVHESEEEIALALRSPLANRT